MACCPRTKRCSSCGDLKCDFCGECFKYNPNCVAELGQHSCRQHWLHKIGHFVQKSTFGPKMEVQWISNAKVNIRRLKHDNYLDLYRTTIESWIDGPTDLRCCSCGYVGPPYIRKQKNKVSSTRFGHYLLMACWPIFFAPLSTTNEISIYCKNCGAYFGSYDMDTGCLIPTCCSSQVSCKVSSCGRC